MNAPHDHRAVSAEVTLTLDGRTVQARPGETLLTLASRLGVEVPHLCFEEGCRPDGNCRACVVEI